MIEYLCGPESRYRENRDNKKNHLLSKLNGSKCTRYEATSARVFFFFPNLVNPLDIIFSVTKFISFMYREIRNRSQHTTYFISIEINFEISLNKSINHGRADKLIENWNIPNFRVNCIHFVCLFKTYSSCALVVSKWKQNKTRFSISTHWPNLKCFENGNLFHFHNFIGLHMAAA